MFCLQNLWWKTFFHPFSYTTLCPFLELFLPFVHRSNSAHFFSSWSRGHLFLEDFFESTEQSSELFFGFASCVLCMHVHSELKPSMQLTSTLTWLYYPTVFDLTLVFHEALSLDDMIWLFTPRTSKEFHQLINRKHLWTVYTRLFESLPQKSCIAMSSTITSLKVLHHDSCPIVIKLPHCKTCFKPDFKMSISIPTLSFPKTLSRLCWPRVLAYRGKELTVLCLISRCFGDNLENQRLITLISFYTIWYHCPCHCGSLYPVYHELLNALLPLPIVGSYV